MPNWWLQWAERIAQVLAERWACSLAARRCEGPEDRPAATEPEPEPGPRPASAPGPDTPR